MSSPIASGLRRFVAGGVLSLIFTCVVPIGVHAGTDQASVALGRTKRIAETQHEIVMLLIKKKEYEKAVSEAEKIFNMRWPQDQESLLISELRLLSDQFLRQGQAPRSLQLVEMISPHFKTKAGRIAILKEKGYIYKCMGQTDKAYDYFKEAIRLEDDD